MEKKFKKELARLVRDSRKRNSDIRFGQLLYSLISVHDIIVGDYEVGKGAEYASDFHSRLFYIEDDELAKIIEESR